MSLEPGTQVRLTLGTTSIDGEVVADYPDHLLVLRITGTDPRTPPNAFHPNDFEIEVLP